MTEKLYLGTNQVVIGGVIQSSVVRDKENSPKKNTDFLVRVNMLSYNGKPYQFTAYCSHYGDEFAYKAGDYVSVTGSLKTVKAADTWKTVIDVKTLTKIFHDPQGIIPKKEYVKKDNSKNYDNVGGPPLDEPPDIGDDDMPF